MLTSDNLLDRMHLYGLTLLRSMGVTPLKGLEGTISVHSINMSWRHILNDWLNCDFELFPVAFTSIFGLGIWVEALVLTEILILASSHQLSAALYPFSY